jgi:hypothetical protein
MTAFNLLDLDTAIRLALVSATTGLVRSVSKIMAPSGTKAAAGLLPYVVFLAEDFDTDPQTFDSDALRVVYQVQIIDHADNEDGPVAAVWDAIVGNANPPSTLATSGLHRRRLTLSGDNTAAVVGLLGGGHMYTNDPDAHGVFLRFQTFYEKG